MTFYLINVSHGLWSGPYPSVPANASSNMPPKIQNNLTTRQANIRATGLLELSGKREYQASEGPQMKVTPNPSDFQRISVGSGSLSDANGRIFSGITTLMLCLCV